MTIFVTAEGTITIGCNSDNFLLTGEHSLEYLSMCVEVEAVEGGATRYHLFKKYFKQKVKVFHTNLIQYCYQTNTKPQVKNKDQTALD